MHLSGFGGIKVGLNLPLWLASCGPDAAACHKLECPGAVACHAVECPDAAACHVVEWCLRCYVVCYYYEEGDGNTLALGKIMLAGKPFHCNRVVDRMVVVPVVYASGHGAHHAPSGLDPCKS